jgi:hypothetical protein
MPTPRRLLDRSGPSSSAATAGTKRSRTNSRGRGPNRAPCRHWGGRSASQSIVCRQ